MNLFKMALIALFLSTGLQAQDKKQAGDSIGWDRNSKKDSDFGYATYSILKAIPKLKLQRNSG